MNLKVKLLEKYYGIKYSLVSKPEIDYGKEFKKIALILTSPLGLGDLVMMVPVINSFRKDFPKAKIHLITDRDLFDKVNFIDEIKIVKGSLLGLRKEFSKLSCENYDLGVVMARAVNQSLYVDALKPRYKLGYLGGYNILSNFKLKGKLSFDKDIHFTTNSLKILESMRLKSYTELVDVDFDSKVKIKVKKFYESLKLDKKKKTIALNPYVLWESRRWDENNYIELVLRLHEKFNFILVGGPDAVELNNEILNKLKNINVLNLTGKFNVKESIYFLKFVDLFIASDSGPMHFSLLMKRPTLAFFGPVVPNHRLPLKSKGSSDYFWYKDYAECSMYDYESEHLEDKLNGLKAIPIDDVEKKVLNFFKEGKFR